MQEVVVEARRPQPRIGALGFEHGSQSLFQERAFPREKKTPKCAIFHRSFIARPSTFPFPVPSHSLKLSAVNAGDIVVTLGGGRRIGRQSREWAPSLMNNVSGRCRPHPERALWLLFRA